MNLRRPPDLLAIIVIVLLLVMLGRNVAGLALVGLAIVVAVIGIRKVWRS